MTKILIVGVVLEDNSTRVHYFTCDFEAACQQLYSKYPNFVSILTLDPDEVDPFLENKWRDQE